MVKVYSFTHYHCSYNQKEHYFMKDYYFINYIGFQKRELEEIRIIYPTIKCNMHWNKKLCFQY